MNVILWRFPSWLHHLFTRFTKMRLVKSTGETNKVTYRWEKYYPAKCDICGSKIRYKETDWKEIEPITTADGKTIFWQAGEIRYGCKDHKPEKGRVYRMNREEL